MTATQADPTNKDGDKGGLGGLLSTLWSTIGGKMNPLHDAGSLIDKGIGSIAVTVLEALKGFFRDDLGWSTFGNGGMGAHLIDDLESTFKPKPAPAPAVQTPAPAIHAPSPTQ